NVKLLPASFPRRHFRRQFRALTAGRGTDYRLSARSKGARGFARRAKPTVIRLCSTARTPPCCLAAIHRLEHGGRMTPHPLPDLTNLEQLKKQAKSLLRAAQARDADALQRFAALPAFSSSAVDAIASAVALHDAQSVIAREHGFASWNALREDVEARTLSF